jgi:hypothetical protein
LSAHKRTPVSDAPPPLPNFCSGVSWAGHLFAVRHGHGSASHSRRLALAIATAALLVVIGGGSAAAVPVAQAKAARSVFQPLLPDLVADAPENLQFQRFQQGSAPPSLQLRFDGFVHNAGPGILEILGTNPDSGPNPRMQTVVQREYAGPTTASAYRDVPIQPTPRVQYQAADGHQHFHLWDVAQYFLAGTGESSTDLSFAKASIGFCIVDVEPVEANSDSVPQFTRSANNYCQWNNPGAQSVFMGLSPGWRDVYIAALPFQDIDVSDVEPGPYRIASVVDPLGMFQETNKANNRSAAGSDPRLVIPGYVPLDDTLAANSPAPVLLSLPSQKYTSTLSGAENPGPPQYLITSAPRHGSLEYLGLDGATANGWNDGRFAYVPALGFQGRDSIRFAVRDSAQPDFPYEKPQAQITINDSGY